MEAFIYGLSFRIPNFQLSEQGIWTSLGAAISYSLLAISLSAAAEMWASDAPPFLSAAIFGVIAAFLWVRAGAFLSQRLFFGAIIILLAFAFQASLAAKILVVNMMDEMTRDDEILYFLGFLIIFLNLALYRVRAYR